MPSLPSLDSEAALYKKQSRSNLTTSLGIKRNYIQNEYERSESRVDTTDPRDYRSMWQNDGQVAAIVNLPKLIILGAGYDIIGEKGSPELEFVKNNLLRTSARGGIKTPIDEVIEDMTYAPFEGARYYELVYRLEGAQIMLDKIAPRDNLTVYPLADDSGSFAGFIQRADFFNKEKEVFIPNEKAVAVIFNEAYGGLKGLPMLKAAWYHWDKKHKLYFISHLASELQTIPPKIIKVKDASIEEKQAVERGIDNLGIQSRVTIPFGSIEVEELGRSGAPTVEIKGMIDHHDSQISKSLLAQFIDLGSEGSGGSRALGDSQIDLYLDFIRGIRRKIQNAFNDVIIPRLVDYNFTSQNYPEFVINDSADRSKDILLEVFAELGKKGSLPTSTQIQVIKKVSDEIGIEFDEELEKTATEEVQEVIKPDAQKEAELNTEDPDKVELEDVTETRSLTPEERRVNFSGLSSNIDRTSNDIYTSLARALNDGKPGVMQQIERILETQQASLLSDIQVADKNQMIAAVEKSLNEIFDYAKQLAGNEIGVETPSTDSTQKSLIAVAAAQAITKLLVDLSSEIVNTVKQNMIDRVDNATTKATVNNLIDGYTERLNIVAEQNTVNTVNQGRLFTFNQNEDLIQAYRYSAVLDRRTTRYCRSLDGKVFTVGSMELANVTPPNHFRCRSILVAIKKTDKVSDPVNPDVVSYASILDFKDRNALLTEELSKKAEDIANKALVDPVDKIILDILKDAGE